MRTLCSLIFCLVLAAASTLPAAAGELAGVNLPDTTRVGEETLVLNGLGLRKKAIFKVYVGGLYLPARTSDAGRILAGDTARHMVMEFVRGVGSGSLADAWTDCLEANTPDAPAEVAKQFEELRGWMADVESGDQLTFTYQPGTGTQVTVKGADQGTQAGKPFADALFACWIGPEPPSEDFRDGLLGQ